MAQPLKEPMAQTYCTQVLDGVGATGMTSTSCSKSRKPPPRAVSVGPHEYGQLQILVKSAIIKGTELRHRVLVIRGFLQDHTPKEILTVLAEWRLPEQIRMAGTVLVLITNRGVQ